MGACGKAMSNTVALSIENLRFAYQGKLALDDVSFTINASDFTFLLGPNGAGKSTLFALITRLYDCREGKIALNGFDIKQQTRKALATLGIVFQQTTLDVDLTVQQNLHYHAALYGMSRKLAKSRIQEELERLAMFERRSEKVAKLNGGHKRRVEIARALLHKPSILLLDEPTVGLDVQSRVAIVEYIHYLTAHEQLAVLWASHLLDEIYSTDQVLVMHKGKIKAKGHREQIVAMTQTKDINTAFAQLTQGELS